jgi:endonuclease/exonuclease/phosphatase family metal-dependent hydrolase
MHFASELPLSHKTTEAGFSMVFTVASYNIHRCIGMDGKHHPERTVRVIRQLQADVVGLQEVESHFGPENNLPQLEYLAEATGMTAIPGPTIRRQDALYGNVLLASHEPYSIERVDLSVDGREPRGAIQVELDMRGCYLCVVVTHLGLTAMERKQQVETLLETFRPKQNHILVLMGDFNEWHPFRSLLRSLHRCLGKVPAPRTYPSRYPILALDRIWVRPRKALKTIKVHRSPLARVASDHLPIKAQIKVSPPSAP